jgi:GTP-binding protein
VYLVADAGSNTLRAFRTRHVFKATDGERGGSKNMHGAGGEPLNVVVPVGTTVSELSDDGEERLLGDLSEADQKLLVAQGGRGGWGNARFTSATNQQPLLAEAGDAGEERKLRLDLKILADAGLIGMPNAGKSSILTAVSAARPKIADYPFTTLEPVLGVIYRGYESLVVADIPGLIEGAHRGVGLGIDFLKHIERARALVHVVDGSSDDPAGNIETVDTELANFSPEMAAKPQLIAVNKSDVPGVRERRRSITASIRRKAGTDRQIIFVSAATHEGLDSLVAELWTAVARAREKDQLAAPEPKEVPVLRPRPVDERPNAVTEGPGVFRIVHPWAVRLARGSRLDDWATRVQYHARLHHLRVTQELERLGVRQGDKVLVADWEFVWE